MRRILLQSCLILLVSVSSGFAQYYADPPVRSASFQAPGDAAQPDADPDDGLDDLLNLDVAQLSNVEVAPSLNLEVTSVSRSQSTVGKSPAAIFVITNDMIRRSAARTVPEVLRMVPGVNVQRISGTRWAISIRGLTSRFANKLLVQIDGRSVYTPLFAGTFWDEQDVLLEDVERIEVIRGPGATVWGANAVNGVINVITKHAKDTHGTYVNVGAGDEWQSFSSARVGGRAGKNLDYRVYGKWQERDSSINAAIPARDDFRMSRVGGRLDWKASCCDSVTLQGEFFGGASGGQAVIPTVAFPFS
ncbi:MAG: TonB-dependent receptor plug domain-containing protein, partial [Planctomycetales bacterium]